jgi:PAS domain S-box-containing protein
MLFELWGATAASRLALPERPLGYLLLFIYSGLLLAALYQQRQRLVQLTRRQWLLTLILFLTALFFSQLFPISIHSDNQLSPLGTTRNPVALLVPFAAVPFLLAGAVLNPGAALIVGLASGLGRGLWQTHYLLEPFHWALVAYVAALWLQQNYHGRLYQALRQAAVGGPLALIGLAPFIGLATFAYADRTASSLAALDLALSTARASFWPLLLEGLFGGLLVMLILAGIPPLRQRAQLMTPSPQQSSLNNRLLTYFGVFAFALSATLIMVGFTGAVNAATQLVVAQMAHDAQTVSAKIPDFLTHRQHLLTEYGQNPGLRRANSAELEQTLRQLYRTGNYYRRVILVAPTESITAFYPRAEGEVVSLTELERMAITTTLSTGQPIISTAQVAEEIPYVITIVVPVFDEAGQMEGALLGRIPEVSLQDLIAGLQGTVGQGTGFIVDERDQIIAHPDRSRLLLNWTPPEEGGRLIGAATDRAGAAYEGRQGHTNARELVYYLREPIHPWTVVITVPYEVVLRMALQIGQHLAGVLIVAMLIFAVNLLYMGRSITRPLNELVQVSRSIAGGSLNTPIKIETDDEVGQLGHAFSQMQVSLKKRLDELSLLLSVSQGVSASMDINQGMPLILQGALRGTGAAGVRAVVLNPSGRVPVTFGEGPSARTMALFDRQIMNFVRQGREFVLCTAEDVQRHLDPQQNLEASMKALIALPLVTHERFQGILWLGYRQPHEFDQAELNLLHTLASQASVLVENARLFATAEGGRRRLAAVLSSTTDAVIVTDQTERIILINPAMEHAFNLRAADIVNRPVTDVIKVDRLVEALTSDGERGRSLEVSAGNGKTFYASVSPIMSNDGQALGRVAVFHDITFLKEVDGMKSEFVATVSHDLRSPLTFMRGYATMMPMVGELTPKQQEYVEKILAGIEQMSSLVDDLLDLGRLEAGIELVLDRINVPALLAAIVSEHAQPAQQKGIILQLKLAPDLPAIAGDVSLLRQAITNLINNTLKYAPNSGVVVLEAAVEGRELVITVKDNGPGITKQDQLRLFEKFYRIQHKGKTVIKGTGLGLSIVKTIAERHGGRAWCHSEVGKGSAFAISLPLE